MGKTDIVKHACKSEGVKLQIAHPVVSDPTDFKGMPFVSDGQADFLPFAELRSLINATESTVLFIDDLGQASIAVQAAIMQLLLAREINGQKISDHVMFIAATNSRSDRAGVTGMLEPVKSRFSTIVTLDISSEDWIDWAIQNDMPMELISFIGWKPDLLNGFKPTSEIVNTSTPRTIANLGRLQNKGLTAAIRDEVFKGATGEAFATEYIQFLNMFSTLPDLERILSDPMSVDLPKEVSQQYAIACAIASRITEETAENGFKFIERLPTEVSIATMKSIVKRNIKLGHTAGFASWAARNGSWLGQDTNKF